MSKECECHDQKQGPSVDKRARRKLLTACVLSLLFMTAEIIGGYLANSLAIASDAAHLLTDLASFLISLLALYFASRPPTQKLSFGWYRAEILGALVSILLLWVITVVLCYMAVIRVIKREFEVNATIMLITAGCGVAFNLAMGLTLHQGSHGHSHGEHGADNNGMTLSDSDKERLTLTSFDCEQGNARTPQTSYGGLSINGTADEISEGKQDGHSHKSNINISASFLHVMGDLLQSIGVLIAALFIYFKPEWKLADPICTFVFSVIVIGTTIAILRDILLVLMEGTPRHLDFKTIHQSLKSIPEVEDIHDLRIWSLSMDKIALSVHIAVSKTTDTMVVLKKIRSLIRSQFGITETTIQFEEYMRDMEDCSHCKDI
ncbi:proton-coupled zinc antiporter SLC30A2-like isoform X2 [Ruditapes philippinarum]|uniref:proton-coupled zinc antiporter SLC30A2-like isoform X2 n=1 Tax=Ruditapes philippinarum TaxID=129788 RepID=UPI00295AC863|nr:proton-coupled zinc antiporter SLC30A2-like isoform X2 [Ruditapes philippinarum]